MFVLIFEKYIPPPRFELGKVAIADCLTPPPPKKN